jgi:2-hydroxychromene-2-carboxylate isomerase
VKQALADATAQAASNGVFGVPTFRVDGDDELFWGGGSGRCLALALAGQWHR